MIQKMKVDVARNKLESQYMALVAQPALMPTSAVVNGNGSPFTIGQHTTVRELLQLLGNSKNEWLVGAEIVFAKTDVYYGDNYDSYTYPNSYNVDFSDESEMAIKTIWNARPYGKPYIPVKDDEIKIALPNYISSPV